MGNLVNIETQVTIAGWTVFSTLLHFCFVWYVVPWNRYCYHRAVLIRKRV